MSESPGTRQGWLARLKAGLNRTSSRIVDGIAGAMGGRPLDAAARDDLIDVLIAADLGIGTAERLVDGAIARAAGKSALEVRRLLAHDIAELLRPLDQPLAPLAAHRPHVILVCGVNGSGKTTTVAKLAQAFKAEGRSVVLAGADTFRAAAQEQLAVWAERLDVPLVSAERGADAAGVAFRALEKARAANADVLLIDTAGRLQNKDHLMAELNKIVRALNKFDPGAPHDCVLVLDATVGQNAHSQTKAFCEIAPVSGLILTKLDGTAKGGVLVALAESFHLPVHAIGIGEQAADLRPLDADAFAQALFGVEGDF